MYRKIALISINKNGKKKLRDTLRNIYRNMVYISKHSQINRLLPTDERMCNQKLDFATK